MILNWIIDSAISSIPYAALILIVLFLHVFLLWIINGKKEFKSTSKYVIKARFKYYLAAILFAFVMSLFFSGNTPKRNYAPNQSWQQSSTEQEYADKSNSTIKDRTPIERPEFDKRKEDTRSLFEY